MKTLRFVLGDQLTRSLASLKDLDPARDVVLMVEARRRRPTSAITSRRSRSCSPPCATSRRRCGQEGIDVDYVRLDAPGHSGSFDGEFASALQARHHPDRVEMTEPGE